MIQLEPFTLYSAENPLLDLMIYPRPLGLGRFSAEPLLLRFSRQSRQAGTHKIHNQTQNHT